jgi:hypothetical protein
MRRILQPYVWLGSGVIGSAEFLSLMTGGPGRQSPRNWGLVAIQNGAGYDRWGAMQTKATSPRVAEFPETMERIRTGGSRFEPGDAVSAERWATFLAVLDRLEQAGVRTIVILPPLAGRLQAAMRQTGRFGYIDELRQRLAGVPLAFDFFDPSSIGSDDCEFLSDGFHAAPVAWARIARSLAERLPRDLRVAFGGDEAGREIARFDSSPRPPGTEAPACRS